MVKMFELHQQNTDISNYQSRVVEYSSFEDYLKDIDNISLPQTKDIEIYEKHINYACQSVTFMFELKFNERWVEYTYFAQVIS